MKKIDIEDDYSIYWWVIRHFRIMDFQSNKEIFKKGYIKLDSPLCLVNKNFKYFSNSRIFPYELIVNCMLGNYPKGYFMLDEYMYKGI